MEEVCYEIAGQVHVLFSISAGEKLTAPRDKPFMLSHQAKLFRLQPII